MTIDISTKLKIINEGKIFLQKFGFDGFSFQDIADALCIRKQSIQTYFKTKEDLANALVEEYRDFLKSWSKTVSYFKPKDQIGAWFDCIFQNASEDQRYCSIAAFASDYNSLPQSTQKKLNQVYGELKKWFGKTIAQGQKDKIFRRDFTPKELTELVLAIAFGGQQLSRLSGDPKQVKKREQDALKILQG